MLNRALELEGERARDSRVDEWSSSLHRAGMSAESPARDVARAVADPAERSVEDVVLERIAERDARSARGSTALARDLFREQDELLARLADVETRRAEAERRARESEARAVSLEEERR